MRYPIPTDSSLTHLSEHVDFMATYARARISMSRRKTGRLSNVTIPRIAREISV